MPRASDVTSREAVLSAIAEFDEIGRNAFLEKYGFGRSLEYVLVHNEREYDSKALLGAAYSYQGNGGDPLTSRDFSGGDETRRVLERLGFEVRSLARVVEIDHPNEVGIRTGMERALDRYASARSGPFGKTPELWDIFEGLKSAFNESVPIASRPTVSTTWSAGVGNWARIPWIAFLDSRETRTTQHGVYPVLLFREDLTGVYMTIAQGVTEPRKHGRDAMTAHLDGVAFDIHRQSPELQAAGFALEKTMDLKTDAPLGRDYEASVIAHKLYEKDRVPEDAEILKDLEAALAACDRYIDAQGVTSLQPVSDQPNAFLIYVGSGSEANLRIGLERGVWGFVEWSAPR